MISNTRVVLNYVDAINKANIDKLSDLMSDDYVFIDSHDNRIEGKEAMKQSWAAYLSMFPDYKIEINDVLERDSMICILGYASGTYKNLKNDNKSNYWRVPAAWTAVVKDDQVRQWQVYADNTVAMQIIHMNEGKDLLAER